MEFPSLASAARADTYQRDVDSRYRARQCGPKPQTNEGAWCGADTAWLRPRFSRSVLGTVTLFPEFGVPQLEPGLDINPLWHHRANAPELHQVPHDRVRPVLRVLSDQAQKIHRHRHKDSIPRKNLAAALRFPESM